MNRAQLANQAIPDLDVMAGECGQDFVIEFSIFFLLKEADGLAVHDGSCLDDVVGDEGTAPAIAIRCPGADDEPVRVGAGARGVACFEVPPRPDAALRTGDRADTPSSSHRGQPIQVSPMHYTPGKGPPPRVLVIMAEQWPRALLRAALEDAGYDAVGARSVLEAMRQEVVVPDRGAVGLIVIDRPVVAGAESSLAELNRRFGTPIAMLLTSAVGHAPEGPWKAILRRPVSIGQVVQAVRERLPLAATGSGSID
jgi:hypothetical protein